MSAQYHHQHYVPQWYQKNFVEAGATENVLQHLWLRPRVITDSVGKRRELPRQRRRSIRKCFAETDLYTLRFPNATSTAIEQFLFGEIDDRGNEAVEYWKTFEHPSLDERALRGLLLYMSAQKLRTPKGLDWLAAQLDISSTNLILEAMVELRGLYTAIWTESVWQIADANKSDTKFIVSDHPVTVYNRRCGPRHAWCRGANDPDIRLHGSHTIFPLGLEKVLILTNMSWARDPYQTPTSLRPNPTLFRDSVFNVFDVQTHRMLREEEVRQINFIVKSRAYRYIAAAKEEWLYPERFVSRSDWSNFGHGYLLMPDPRALYHGGEMVLGYADGSTDAFDVYGRKPWDPDYGVDDRPQGGRDPLQRFQGEFARLIGPYRRGRSFRGARLEDERDSDDFHQYHLDSERQRMR